MAGGLSSADPGRLGLRLSDVLLESPEGKASPFDDAFGRPLRISEEQLRALHEKRAKYERQLANLTEGRRAAGERALKHMFEKVARLEERITTQPVERHASDGGVSGDGVDADGSPRAYRQNGAADLHGGSG